MSTAKYSDQIRTFCVVCSEESPLTSLGSPAHYSRLVIAACTKLSVMTSDHGVDCVNNNKYSSLVITARTKVSVMTSDHCIDSTNNKKSINKSNLAAHAHPLLELCGH